MTTSLVEEMGGAGYPPKMCQQITPGEPVAPSVWKRNEAVPTAQDCKHCSRAFDQKLRDRLEAHKKDSRDGLTERDLLKVWPVLNFILPQSASRAPFKRCCAPREGRRDYRLNFEVCLTRTSFPV
mmetsp:Transcript_65064/g.172318  ORF Transcript_65064/g.172318 Transcript_65064/m.172318 type:complete len:125 (+) Transcript_65064:229-603(+)